ncbi:hypothetical protein WA556_006253, partial [Blastocystis sp. ATCC 50177/Nand II]
PFHPPRSALLAVEDEGTLLRHTGSRPHWCFETFALPPRESEQWTVRVEYEGGQEEMEVMVGVVEEVVNSEDAGFNAFLGSEKTSYGYKTTGQLFHGNFCTSNVVSYHGPCFRVCFDASLHQLRLLLGDSDAIVLFDGLPEKWVPAVALWRPGDSVRVKLLPETAASASQQCELEKNDVTVLNAVSDDAFELFSLLLKDVVSQLRDGREESRLWAFRDRFIHRE